MALLIEPDGNAVRLEVNHSYGVQTVLRTAIQWNAGQWHQVALTVSVEQGTVLWLDGTPAASGAAVTLLSPSVAGYVNGFGLGSDEEGRHLAQGDFDELTMFSRVLGQSELAANYTQNAGRTLLGPIWPGENTMASVPFPGESTNGFTGSTTSVMRAVSYGCGLWVELGRTNSATNVVLTLHNTMPGTNYQIWSKTSLGESSWTLETNMVGASGQDWTAETIPMRGRSNLFLIASMTRTYEWCATGICTLVNTWA